jgi:hypothetical protein
MSAISKDLLVADPAIVLSGDSVVSLMRDAAGNAVVVTAGKLQTQDSSIKVGNTASAAADLAQPILAVRNDAGTTIATATGNYAPLQVDATGALRIAGNLSLSSQYAEDAPHVSTNLGLFTLGVRSDVPTSATNADGDYAAVTVDSTNRMWVNQAANISQAVAATAVSTTAVSLYTAIPGQKRVMIQNNGTSAIFIGPTGVTTANGIRIPASGSYEQDIGPNIAMFAIAQTGTQAVRIHQLA